MNNKIIKSYRSQAHLRHSLNTLAEITFDGLNFETWYQNGYWNDHYNPYSIVINEKVAANVSVNLIDFIWNGQRKHFVQLGTVMTEETFRNQGLIRQIMHEIDLDYKENMDGIYLFGNDSVLDFYPKFGFKKAMEYQYTKPFSTSGECGVVPVPMKNKEDWKKFENAIKQSVSYSRLRMVDNDSLIMFYITGSMQGNVYYDSKHNAYIIAEIDSDTLTVHDIFSPEKYPMDDIFAEFGSEVRHIILGFTPIDRAGYTISAFRKEDCTLFVKGREFDGFEEDQVIFPTLSHA